MRTLFIVNPTSGRDRSAPLRRKLLDYVSRLPDSDAIVLTGPGEASRVAGEAAAKGYECIVVAGGDGTVNEVINGMRDDDVCLGIVPLGTGNVLASELGLDPDDLDNSLDTIAAAKIRHFDLGLAGDRRFLLMAGFGFDAEVVRDVASRAKGIFGRLAYAPTLVRESVRYRPSEFVLKLDGACLSTTAYNVIVCNCSTYAPNFQIAPDALPDDGLLDVLVLEHRPAMKLRFLGWLWASLFRRWAADSAAVHYQAKLIRIDSSPVVKMQLDGDVRGESGVDIVVLPKALRLIVP